MRLHHTASLLVVFSTQAYAYATEPVVPITISAPEYSFESSDRHYLVLDDGWSKVPWIEVTNETYTIDVRFHHQRIHQVGSYGRVCEQVVIGGGLIEFYLFEGKIEAAVWDPPLQYIIWQITMEQLVRNNEHVTKYGVTLVDEKIGNWDTFVKVCGFTSHFGVLYISR